MGLSPKEIEFLMRQTGASTFANLDELIRMQNFSKTPFLVNPAARQSTADYFYKKTENTQKLNAWNEGREYSEKEEQEILQNEVIFGVTEKIRKAIRDSDMSDEDKERYTTGITRWSLDRKEVADWPNILVEYQREEIPPALKLEVVKALKSGLRMPRLEDKTPEGIRKFKRKVAAKTATTKKLVKGE